MTTQSSIYITNPEFEKIKHQAYIIDVRSKFEHDALICFENDHNIYIHDLLRKCWTVFAR